MELLILVLVLKDMKEHLIHNILLQHFYLLTLKYVMEILREVLIINLEVLCPDAQSNTNHLLDRPYSTTSAAGTRAHGPS